MTGDRRVQTHETLADAPASRAASGDRAATAVDPFTPGAVLAGKYEVERVLGRGGMGIVVAARHLKLRERVAIKLLRPEALDSPDLVARFTREARAAVKIKSEHVARVIDVGELDDGAPFMVMEYLDGVDLAAVIRERAPLPIEEAVDYVMQACVALAEAHGQGIVHRDVKPENLFLCRGGGWSIVKVLDFGISKAALTGSPIDDGMQLTQTLTLMGSPLYMAPEQIRRGKIDARTDIWSLGIVLHELLTGKVAFPADSITELCARVLEDETPGLRRSRPDAPVGLEHVITRCLAKNADGRFDNVGELVLALLPFGPRRSRMSAERVTSMISASGVTRVALSVPGSLPPPPGEEGSLRPQMSRTQGTSQAILLTPSGSVTAPSSGISTVKLFAVAAAAAALALGVAMLLRPAPSAPPVLASATAPPPSGSPPPMASVSASAPSSVAPPVPSVPSSPDVPDAAAKRDPVPARPQKPTKRTGKPGEPDLGF